MFFFFIACAGISIIVWVFNWICWFNQCCCCDFLHNPINKRLVWWTSFIFLLGILACCISGFVTTNRFGFALEGSYCSFERFYYDSLYGQLKETYPKWEGFESIENNFTDLISFLNSINVYNINNLLKETDLNLVRSSSFKYEGYYSETYINLITEFENSGNSDAKNLAEKVNQRILPIALKYAKIIDSIKIFQDFNTIFRDNLTSFKGNFSSINNDFQNLKTKFINEFHYFAKIAKGWGKVLTMIYFCLLLIVTTFACISMMFYACLRRQGYLSTFMHVLWNIIRFFIFSFFFYGAAYGMCYLALRDAVAYVMFVFGEDNLDINGKSYLIPINKGKEYLNYCLLNSDSDYKKKLNIILTSSIEDFFKSKSELDVLFTEQSSHEDFSDYTKSNKTLEALVSEQNSIYSFINNKIEKSVCAGDICHHFPLIANRLGGIFGYLNCTFLKSDLNMMYRTLYDLSVEARILCALSCCIGFFGAIAVYFYLLVLHHYNTEIFFDTGKSIFTGFDRIGNNKKKYSSKDPAYKKRKIRSEIELSSRNEEYSGYQAANKGEN